MNRLFILLLFAATWLGAESIFTLRGVDKVYPVVDISGEKVPKSSKTYLREALDAMTGELGIDTKGYSGRSLALLVAEQYVGKSVLISVRLVIGEQVQRTGSKDRVFALTYQNALTFPYDSDTVEENLEDSVDELLAKFADQYAQERGTLKRVKEKGSLAASLGYETNFDNAVKRAKKEHKNVMLVLVANYCPWCRKFEELVLRKEDVNALVHQKYVPVILNKEKDAFPPEFNISFTPVVHFIDPVTLKGYHTVAGYNSREEFTHWLGADKRP
ncbi:thioredoxin family protein [Sulfurimonas sp. HSL-3221]|uniref:thioredoxin family protein n=1 Tax=Sulfurimonadaceae TaxID=2771471 RepID=UPI001E62B68F|nr:thioredoxin family protein [Sulfurimonas sp. HSL-3221]UFS61614.1 thioredoxin family protein [Sulfurimonas sp. HSL-3221]